MIGDQSQQVAERSGDDNAGAFLARQGDVFEMGPEHEEREDTDRHGE